MPAAKSIRSVFFWLHLTAGVIAGLIILVMSVTGTLLAYERQITAWATDGGRVTPPSASAVRLPLDTLVARAQSVASGNSAAGITVAADRTSPVVVSLQDRRSFNVDPYTGHVFTGGNGTRAFFAFITSWHRWLGMANDNRPIGKSITGVCNLMFLFMLLTGLYLWFPRQWTARAFRAVGVWNPRATGRLREWNWHHVFGMWLSPILLLVIVTGVFMSYSWPREWVNRTFGDGRSAEAGPRNEGRGEARIEGGGEGRAGEGRAGEGRAGEARAGEARAGRHERGETRQGAPGEPSSGGRPRSDGPPSTVVSLDTIYAHSAAAVPGWQTMQIRMPRRPGSGSPAGRPPEGRGGRPGGNPGAGPAGGPGGNSITVTISTSTGVRPDVRQQLTLSPKTGLVTKQEGYDSYNTARKITSWIRGVHTGEAGGMIGQTLAALASFAGVILVWTGLSLALRRLRSFLRQRGRASLRDADIPC